MKVGNGFDKSHGLNSVQLKWIALISMLIDHTGATLLYKMIVNLGMRDLSNLYYFMRYIGRIAFPIYCFLLVQGFCHTHNLKKYILQIFLFALISEIPFDYSLNHGKILEFEHQNVFFTLLIGLLLMTALGYMERNLFYKSIAGTVLMGIVIVAASAVSYFMHTDYAGYGILVIAVMYILRNNAFMSMAAGCLVLVGFGQSEFACLFAMLPIAFYNGEKGNSRMKYFFYWFYPVHLTVLSIGCILI